MKIFRRSSLLVISALLAACNNHYVQLRAAGLGDAAPSKADPIYLRLPEKQSPAAFQAGVHLSAELCRNGFNLVSRDKARWVMEYAFATSVEQVGYTTTVNPLWPYRAQTRPEYQGSGTATLAVYRAKGEDGQGPVWQADVAGTDKELEVYGPVIWKVMLDQYGRMYAGQAQLSKDYLYATQAAGPCSFRKPG
jgi:hypothetical protein